MTLFLIASASVVLVSRIAVSSMLLRQLRPSGAGFRRWVPSVRRFAAETLPGVVGVRCSAYRMGGACRGAHGRVLPALTGYVFSVGSAGLSGDAEVPLETCQVVPRTAVNAMAANADERPGRPVVSGGRGGR